MGPALGASDTISKFTLKQIRNMGIVSLLVPASRQFRHRGVIATITKRGLRCRLIGHVVQIFVQSVQKGYNRLLCIVMVSIRKGCIELAQRTLHIMRCEAGPGMIQRPTRTGPVGNGLVRLIHKDIECLCKVSTFASAVLASRFVPNVEILFVKCAQEVMRQIGGG